MEEINYAEKGFDKAPFVRKHLDTATDIVSSRLNEQERLALDKLRKIFHCDSDSTILKNGMLYLHNVVFGQSQQEIYEWIASQRRLKTGIKTS